MDVNEELKFVCCCCFFVVVFCLGGGGFGSGVGLGSQGRCEQRSEVFVKIKKKIVGGSVLWGRVGGGGG